MELYTDALDLIARALMGAILWTVVAVGVGAVVVAVAGADWLPLVAAVAPLVPALAVALIVRNHAAATRERQRRAAYSAQR